MAAVAGLLLLAGCGGAAATTATGTLNPVQITEYEGQKLDAVEDFRENSLHGPQQVDTAAYRLKISGLVETPQEFTYDELLQLPAYQKVVTLDCVEGWSVTVLWEGARIADMLADAGVAAEANTVIFHAYDGYTSSLPLDYLLENDILLAYKQNGNALAPERGYPLQLVAESRWGYKWVKWVTEIELSSDPEYKGYWEKRGFSNDGSLDQSYRENDYPGPMPGF